MCRKQFAEPDRSDRDGGNNRKKSIGEYWSESIGAPVSRPVHERSSSSPERVAVADIKIVSRFVSHRKALQRNLIHLKRFVEHYFPFSKNGTTQMCGTFPSATTWIFDFLVIDNGVLSMYFPRNAEAFIFKEEI
jgi:hypothetical protein